MLQQIARARSAIPKSRFSLQPSASPGPSCNGGALRLRHRPRTTRVQPLKIGLIGNGAIARLLTGFCAGRPDRMSVAGALVLPVDTVSVGRHPLVRTLPELLALKPELVVECAGHGAVAAHGEAILDAGIDLVIVSTGSLADEKLWQRLD